MRAYPVRLAALLCCAMSLTICSCSEEAPQADPREAVLDALAADVIMPAYDDFEAAASELALAARAQCEEGGEREATRAAWRKARVAYKRTEVFAFGPAVDYPERLGPKLDFWPARAPSIEELLAADTPLTAQALAMMGAAQRGLPVAEYLLWPPQPTPSAQAARQCDYLVAASGDIQANAAALARAWRPGEGDYLGALTDPVGAKNGAFEDVQQSLSEVANRMAFTLENIRKEKLGRPLGDETQGMPQPDKTESPYSHHAIQDIQANLDMIQWLFHGREATRGLSGHPRLQARPELIARFDEALSSARAELAAISPDLPAAVSSSPQQVRAAHEAIATLQTLIQVDLIGLLALTQSFNDSDGD